jgi:CheY-like chemotaxis protein
VRGSRPWIDEERRDAWQVGTDGGTGQPPPARDGAAARRILVVDDNRDAADSLGMVLQLLGAHVHVVSDGPSALEAYDAHAPEIVLLDIGMPGMDGYEVARGIRERDPARRTAIVALTGWGQDTDRRRARDAGFDHHLVKPADMGMLKQLLTTLDSGSTEGTAAS